jgi:tyrosine decarboxylase / aspartate 1-decarboxylase
VPGGDFARGLALGRAAALDLYNRLRNDPRFQPLAAGPPELDIVVWKLNADPPDHSSSLAQKTFVSCASRDLHLALVQLPHSWFHSPERGVNEDAGESVTCLRSVLMKPEHSEWLDSIWSKLSSACK